MVWAAARPPSRSLRNLQRGTGFPGWRLLAPASGGCSRPVPGLLDVPQGAGWTGWQDGQCSDAQAAHTSSVHGRGPGWCLVAISVSREGTWQTGQAQPRATSCCLCSWLLSLQVWGCGRGVYSPSIDNPGRLAGRGESTLSHSLLPCQAHLVCSSDFISFPLRFVLPNWPGTMFNQHQQQQGTCLPRLQCPPCPHRPPLPPRCHQRAGAMPAGGCWGRGGGSKDPSAL